jgi:hypothetical protein
LADVNANIGINFDTSQALAQLRQLQSGLSRFNQTLTQGNVAAINAQKGLNSQLMQAINATGKFVATQKDVATSTSSFTSALEKNQLSMRQYFRYTAAAATQNTKVFKGMFAQERETLTRASKDRVKLLQSQYIQMQSANGDMIKTLQVVPKHLKMVNGQYADYATRMQMAAQRQQFLNKLLSQGSTQLLNFGKNTQWAGRQLMVGLTIPLSILGSTAAKTFMEMEQAVLKFSRVYGDMLTSGDATNKAIEDIQRLGKEFTKYGVAVKDTMDMAATAAAMGLTGDALNAQVINATKLSVLGQVEMQQALETTISLQNAFGISSEQLAGKINFLNAVENQTVLSIEDLTIAIPKAAPIVRQLGGSVEDLAFFMTAMKEGGINASEGANALKSGLASMINPAEKSAKFLAELGINIKGIVDANAGNLKGTVIGFAKALDTLDPLNRARAIEQLFGKFQFARLSTLFSNVTKDSSQASRALGLAGASIEELAILSERELGKVEDATGTKFKKSMEDLKLQLVPVGKAFLQAVTPIVNFVGKILEKFNGLSDGTKKVIAIMIGVIGGLAPIALMTFGILANGVANLIKFFAMLRGGIAKLNGSNNVLGGGFDYLTNQQIENLASSNALHTSHSQLISTFNVEQASVNALAAAYGNAATQARALAQSSPGLFNSVPGPAGAVAGLPPKKFAQGGVVPGSGNKDTVPALLTPGEVVITKQTAKDNPELVAALQNGSVKRYNGGTGKISGSQQTSVAKASNLPGYLQDEYDRINNITEANLRRFADITGKGVGQSVDQIRQIVLDDFEAMLEEIKAKFGSITKEGMTLVGKKFDEEKQSSRMGAYHRPFDQLNFPEFSHVGQTKPVDANPGDDLNLIPKARNQVELIKKFFADQGKDMPELKVADAHAMMLKGKLNNAMSSPEKSAAYEEERGAGSLGLDFQADFEKTGADKWEAMTTMMGGDFDQLKSQAEIYDNMLIEKLKKWNTDNAAKPVPEIFDDAIFKNLESQITAELQTVAPEFSLIIEKAKQSITAIRISLGEDFDAVNAMLKANKAGSLGPDNAKAKILNVEARPDKPKLLGTMPGESIAEKVDADLTAAEKKAETKSPSKRTQRLGKDIADGLALGLEQGKAGVKAQSSQLTDAAMPTSAETQARVDKMDLGNKAFYDDIDTPEMRDERQILKSQDRQRRKLGSTATVDSMSGTQSAPGPSSLTVASSGRTEVAAEKLAVKTEEAVTAQSQVVQQIKDESRSRVTIKGNTVNIQKAREDADKAENEAAITRSRAAAIENEQAAQRARRSPTTITDEQVLAAKEKANAAELKAAETRAALAMAEAEGKDIVISDEDVKDIGKIQKVQDKDQEAISNGTQEQGDGLRRIVDGTEDTAKSTVLVAEKTDEFANVTSDALDAQTETAGNLLTGAQITNATTGNMNDVLQSTDMTGIAQDDIAGSSESIAKINRDIEEDKRKIRELGQQELAARMKDVGAIIPDGAQSSNPVFDKSKAPGYQEAYDEVMGRDPGTLGPDDPGQIGYTRDKKGQFIFDPETGQPTTLTKSQLGKKKRGMRKEKVGKVSGKAAGALGTAAMVAGMAGAPPQVTAALGGAATVAQFAPMIAGLTGPQGIVVALAAVAAGAYLFNKHLNAMAGKAAQFAKDLSATRSGLKAIGEITGKVGASEIMDKRREKSQYGKYDEAIKVDDIFGKQFLGSDPGKKEKELFQKNVKEFGQEKAVSDLALKLATGVADGVLDSNAANSIAAALAIELKDAKLEMQVIGQISSLIGPDGENLEKEPMKARIAIMAKAGSRTSGLEDDIASRSGFGEGARKEVAALAALNMNNLELATMIADQVQVEYETAKQKLEAELASTTNAQKRLEIEKQIETLNTQNARDTQFMNDQILSQINRNAASFAKVYSGSVWGKQAMREDAYFDASRAQVESTYKGTDQEEASKKFLNKTEALSDDTTYGKYNSSTGKYVKTGLGTEEAAQKFQAKMEMLVGSKVLSPGEATSYMDLFRGKLNEMDFLLNMGIKTKGVAKTKELFGMFAGFSSKGRKQATSIITEMVMRKQDPAQFDSMMETLKSIQALDGNTIDFEVLVTTVGLEGLEIIKKEQEALEKIKEDAKKAGKTSLASEDGLSVDATADVSANMKAATDALEKNQDRMKQFKDGSLEQQTEYLQKLAAQVVYEATVNDKTRDADIQFLAAQQAMNEAYIDKIAIGSDAYVAILEKNVAALKLLSDADFAVEKVGMTGLGGVTSLGAKVPEVNPEGKGSNPLDFLDDLAMRIKNVRDGAFDATKPLQSMLAAFSNPKVKKDMSTAFKMFDGLQQRMIGMKVPKEFRDMIMGMSAKDFNELAKLTGDKAIFKFKKDKKGKALPKTKANIEGLTPTGVKMMKTYNEAIVGEANVVNRETVEQITNQERAFKMLIASGASATEALEHVQDAATAAAIASGALGKIGSPERKQYIEDLKKAASETERFALSQKMIMANEEFKLLEQMPKLSTAMQLAGFSADQMTEVLNDPALARHLIEDLKDGKVDSEEIANYLNSIEAKKIIDIQIKFNAGQFSESAKPGLELVDEMFAVQESLLRTGADPRTTAMVDTMNANNKSIKEAEKSAAIFRRQIELINREIEKDQRAIEKNYSRPIEDLSEQVDDLSRELEMNPIFGDRAMEKLNTENTTLSNDLALISNAAEKINEKYDKQAEALQKVSNINDGILSQQKGQLDLADALSKGDISSAAQAMQANRADAAGRLQTDASDALEQARKNEIDGLRGAQSGLSEKDIQNRQFEISQQLYRMETDPRRVAIQEQIRVKQDEIYRLEELREEALLRIRDKEDKILEIQTKQLEPLEDKIEDLTYANTLIQEEIDKLVEEIKVLDQTKERWDRIKARIDANTLAGKDLDKQLGVLLASTDAIDKKWQSILDKLKAYNKTPQGVLDQKKKTEDEAAADLAKAKGDKSAAELLNIVFGDEGDYIDQNGKVMGKRGAVPTKYFAQGGIARGTDTVPAMLTPGEFVMSRPAVDSFGLGNMRAINNGQMDGLNNSKSLENAIKNLETKLVSSIDRSISKAEEIASKIISAINAGIAKESEQSVQLLSLIKMVSNILSNAIFSSMQSASNLISDTVFNTTQNLIDQILLFSTNSTSENTYILQEIVKSNELLQKILDSVSSCCMGSSVSKSIVADPVVPGDPVVPVVPPVVKKDPKTKEPKPKKPKKKGEPDKKDDDWINWFGPGNPVIDQHMEDFERIAFDAKKNLMLFEQAMNVGDVTKNAGNTPGMHLDSLYKQQNAAAIQNAMKATPGMIAQEKAVKEAAARAAAAKKAQDAANLKKFGGNAAAANAFGNWYSGGIVKRFAVGGPIIGTDTVPAMLTPGEFVMSKYAVQSQGIDKMKAINNGDSVGDSVYNYSINVNVSSESNPNEIARVVMAQIKSIDGQKMRGTRI